MTGFPLEVQGRYLFPVLVPVLGLVCHSLVSYIPNRTGVVVSVATGAIFLAGYFPYFLSHVDSRWYNDWQLEISSPEQIKHTLASEGDSSGAEEIIVSADGEKIQIVPGSLDGFVNSVRRLGSRIWITGWASDGAHRHPAVTVAVFIGDAASHRRHERLRRPDVAKAFKTDALVDAGFRVSVPASALDRHPLSVVRVFAISSEGVASELRYHPEYDDGTGKRQLGN